MRSESAAIPYSLCPPANGSVSKALSVFHLTLPSLSHFFQRGSMGRWLWAVRVPCDHASCWSQQPHCREVQLNTLHGHPTSHAAWRSCQPHCMEIPPASCRWGTAWSPGQHQAPWCAQDTRGVTTNQPQHRECWLQLLSLSRTVTTDPLPNTTNCRLTPGLGRGNVLWQQSQMETFCFHWMGSHNGWDLD